ncbi:MAG: DUF6529 family protein [Pseudomonadota bacterium]
MFDSFILGGAIVLGVIGIFNTIVMFEVLGRKRGSDFLKSLHRWLGIVFTGIFTGLFVYMFPRLAFFSNVPVNFLLHGLIAIIVFVLLVAKLCVVRRYKAYAGSVPLLGFYVMLGTMLVVLTSAALELLKQSSH